MQYVITDAGRKAAGFTSEKNDCVVRAYVLATGLSYADAHRILELWGRKKNSGVFLKEFINSKKNFFPFEFYTVKESLSINKFMETHSYGKFIVAIKRHAFAVVNGTVHDLYLPSGRIKINFYVQIF